MGIMAFDTFIFGMMVLDVLLGDGLLGPGRIDRVAFPTKFPGVGFDQFLRFGILDVQVPGTMASLAGEVAVVTLILHRDDGVMTAFAAFVACKVDGKSRDFPHRISPVMTVLAKGIRG